ncbi:MAG: ABC transporter ATP-binding protein [Chlorobiaceae bacterium]|nr:ABC transporter ATP-binding protein [Chlorobiaceae bacterium]
MKYGFSKTVDLSFEAAIEKVTVELKKEGFGVLTTIDVKETMKNKLNVDFPKYKILGACNPTLAHQALSTDDQIGLLLPCNVIVYEKENQIHVSIFNPMLIPRIIENDSMNEMAESVTNKLERVLSAI